MKIRGQDVEIKMKQGHSRDTLGTTYKKIAGASGMFPMDSQRAETLLACTPNHWSNGLMILFCDLATFPMVRFGSFFFYLKVHFPRVM